MAYSSEEESSHEYSPKLHVSLPTGGITVENFAQAVRDTTTAPAEKDSAWSMYDADLDGPILDCVSTDTDGDDEWHGSAVIITWNCQRTKLWSR